MSVRVDLKMKGTQEIIKEKGINRKLQYFFGYTLLRYMTPYVPMDTGMLSQATHVDTFNDHAEIHYLQEYASDVYYNTHGFEWHADKHPLATSYWDKACWTVNKDVITQEVNAYRERLAKNGGK